MTVSLTFDDGITAHTTIVAPLLEKYGWRGAFNVITDFLEPDPNSLTEAKLRILGLTDHPDKRMSWADARHLLARGHEVYPHACTHEKLGDLAKVGRMDELNHEVLDSVKAYQEHLGVYPRFFCCPHLGWTPEVKALVRRHGMELFNNNRPGFGTGTVPQDVVRLLCRKYYEGRRHLDLMFHGIVEREGGHRPFKDEQEFGAILQTLKALERAGKIRVVSYSQAHYGNSCLVKAYDFCSWLRNKVRRVLFYALFRDRKDDRLWDKYLEGK